MDSASSRVFKRCLTLLGQNRVLAVAFQANTTTTFQALGLVFFGILKKLKSIANRVFSGVLKNLSTIRWRNSSKLTNRQRHLKQFGSRSAEQDYLWTP
jgi:hypothetical protein